MSLLLLFSGAPSVIEIGTIDGATPVNGIAAVLNADPGGTVQTLILPSIDGATTPAGPLLVANTSGVHRPW